MATSSRRTDSLPVTMANTCVEIESHNNENYSEKTVTQVSAVMSNSEIISSCKADTMNTLDMDTMTDAMANTMDTLDMGTMTEVKTGTMDTLDMGTMTDTKSTTLSLTSEQCGENGVKDKGVSVKYDELLDAPVSESFNSTGSAISLDSCAWSPTDLLLYQSYLRGIITALSYFSFQLNLIAPISTSPLGPPHALHLALFQVLHQPLLNVLPHS